MQTWTAGIAGILAAGWATWAGAEVEVRKIWSEAKHCAFPDMIVRNGEYLVAFRESDAHVYGEDGRTRLIRSADGDQWESMGVLEKKGVDLRDPKFTMKPDGTVLVLQAGSIYNGRKLEGRECFVSSILKGGDGIEGLTPIVIDEKIRGAEDWLWRLTWRGDHGYGVVYQPEKASKGLHLVRTGNALEYELVQTFDLPGKPNESTVRFAPDGEMWIVVRNEGDDRMGYLGRSRTPFTEWTWKKMNVQLGGPDLLRLDNGTWLVGTRKYAPGGARTMVGTVTAEGVFTEKVVLPSGGDTSYPRMLEVGDKLWMVYYSSHEGSTAIYLAKIPLGELE